MLSDFKEEHKDMLNDMEIIKDYVNFTIQTPKENHEIQFSKNNYDIVIVVACILSSVLNLVFRIQWLTMITCILQIFIFFLIHLIVIDYDFLDDKFTWRMTNFMIKNNRLYYIIYIVILYKWETTFMFKYVFLILDDLLTIILYTIKYLDYVNKQKMDLYLCVFNCLEFVYTGFLSLYLFSSMKFTHIKYSLLIMAYLIFRFKVKVYSIFDF